MATKYNKILLGYQPHQAVKWQKKLNVSRTISVLVLRVLKWLEFPSMSYIYSSGARADMPNASAHMATKVLETTAIQS
jgi:hypothetical protein